MAEVTERQLTARAMSHRVFVCGHDPLCNCVSGTVAMGPVLDVMLSMSPI